MYSSEIASEVAVCIGGDKIDGIEPYYNGIMLYVAEFFFLSSVNSGVFSGNRLTNYDRIN